MLLFDNWEITFKFFDDIALLGSGKFYYRFKVQTEVQKHPAYTEQVLN